MKTSSHDFHVWIFNDASVANFLVKDSPLWREGVPAVIAELSLRPLLALVHDLETPPAYPGISGLLGTQTEPSDLAVRVPGCPVPVILSPHQPVSGALAGAAVRCLLHDPRIHGKRVLLVEAGMVEVLAPVLALANRIGVVWELSTPPGEDARTLAETLASEGLLEPESWSGFIGYFARGSAPTDAELSSARDVLAILPGSELLPPAGDLAA